MKKIKTSRSVVSFCMVFLMLTACSGSSSSSSSSSSTSDSVTLGTEATGAALSALFSSGGNQGVTSLIRNLESSQDVCRNLASGPGKVFMSGRGTAGTFGADGDSVTLTADDFCQSEDGVDQTEAGETPGTRFAQFTFLDTVIGNCERNGEAATVTMLRGSGVVRTTDEATPEIYGTFEIGEDISRCTFRIGEDSTILTESSSCTTSSGEAVTLSSDLSCTMDADLDRLTVQFPIEGHMASMSSESGSVAYGCHQIDPLTVDSDGFLGITSDCSALAAYGFNLEALTYNLIVTGDVNGWGFLEMDGGIADVLNRAKILRLNGYPVLLRVNLIYSTDFDGTNPQVLDPTAEFPAELIDDPVFQEDLTAQIVAIANDAEHAKIEMLAPLSEIDRVFAQSGSINTASTYVASIIDELNIRFTGSLVAIYRELGSEDPAETPLDGFDALGVNLSPLAENVSFEDFQNHVGEQLNRLKTVAESYGLPYFLAGAGITADAANDGNAYDWNATSERVIDVFQEFYERSLVTFATDGIIFREGFPGDVLFSEFTELQDYVKSIFEPVTTDTEVDGEYDPSLSTLTLDWDLVSGPRFVAKGMTMAAYDGKLYVFGGSSEAAGEKTQIYDIANDSWSVGTDMPRYRESAVSVEVDGLIYVIGGNDPDTCSGNYRCAQMANVDVYHPSTNAWTTAASLNERRDVAGAVVYDGKIYVVGGMYSEAGDVQVSNRDSLEVYDPTMDSWTVLNRDIPYPIRSAATSLAGDVIYVIGGCAEHGSDLDELEAENTCMQTVVQTYDIGDGAWSVLENNMPTGRHFSGQHAVATEHGVLVFGGATDLGNTTYGVVEALSFASSSWTYATEMLAHRKSVASAVSDGVLYVVGGAAHGEGYGTDLTDGMERVDLSGL